MKLLELFCGTKSISKEFEKAGFEVVTVDLDPQFEATLTTDILGLPVDAFSYAGFDAVWASPPCDAFSVMVIGKNWNHDHTPKNAKAALGMELLHHTVAMIKSIDPKMFWIENPRAKMRKMPIMAEFPLRTVTYCQYGDTRMKPTDIFTNTDWEPRPPCVNGAPCHDRAPRGSKGGTQGIAGSRDRAVIPQELCAEIAAYARSVLEENK